MNPPRSQFVTLLAWIFIVLSAFGVTVALLQNVMVHLLFADVMRELPPGAAGVPDWSVFVTANLRWFAFGLLVLAVVTLVASIALLQRREWGRWLFIALMLAGVAWNILGVGLQFAMFDSMTSLFEGAPADVAADFRLMQSLIMGVAAAMALGFCLLFCAIVWKLTRPAIRAEFAAESARRGVAR